MRCTLTAKEFPRTWDVVEAGLRQGVAPGCVIGFWEKTHPGVFYAQAFGNRRLVPSSQPMEIDTVFDLASISKVFATATLAAVCVEKGWLDWTTKVSSVFPGYPHYAIDVSHLLSHTAGFPAVRPFWQTLLKSWGDEPLYARPITVRQNEVRREVLALTPGADPGCQTVYSDISFLLLGFLLEEVTGMPLDYAVAKWVWNPMGIHGAYFKRVTESARDGVDDRVAATEDCPWRGGVLQGQVHDDNCWAMGGYGGHTGAFGTTHDVLQFAAALMTGFLPHSILETQWTRVLRPPGCPWTLGWDTPTGEFSTAGTLASRRSVGHLGYTGTSLWIDRDADVAIALLTNRVHPHRTNEAIRQFRTAVHDALRTDILDRLP